MCSARVRRVQKSRIELVLKVAVAHGEKDLVLGAFGCGVFQNDVASVRVGSARFRPRGLLWCEDISGCLIAWCEDTSGCLIAWFIRPDASSYGGWVDRSGWDDVRGCVLVEHVSGLNSVLHKVYA